MHATICWHVILLCTCVRHAWICKAISFWLSSVVSMGLYKQYYVTQHASSLCSTTFTCTFGTIQWYLLFQHCGPSRVMIWELCPGTYTIYACMGVLFRQSSWTDWFVLSRFIFRCCVTNSKKMGNLLTPLAPEEIEPIREETGCKRQLLCLCYFSFLLYLFNISYCASFLMLKGI